MNLKALFAALVCLQLAYLGGTAAYHQARVARGTRVVLQTAPVDPVSPFRGRYVTLAYEISTLPRKLGSAVPKEALQRWTPIYVALKPDGAVWKASGFSLKPPPSGQVALKGKVQWADDETVSVRYGLEEFFLSEKSAKAIEERRRNFWNTARGANGRVQNWMDTLDPEDRRIASNGLPFVWNKIEAEMSIWVESGLMQRDAAEALKQKYTKAFERIEEARTRQRGGAGAMSMPLTTEISIVEDGTGYAVRLFWEGQEYR